MSSQEVSKVEEPEKQTVGKALIAKAKDLVKKSPQIVVAVVVAIVIAIIAILIKTGKISTSVFKSTKAEGAKTTKKKDEPAARDEDETKEKITDLVKSINDKQKKKKD